MHYLIKFNDLEAIKKQLMVLITRLKVKKSKKEKRKFFNFFKSSVFSLIKFNDLEAFTKQLTALNDELKSQKIEKIITQVQLHWTLAI